MTSPNISHEAAEEVAISAESLDKNVVGSVKSEGSLLRAAWALFRQNRFDECLSACGPNLKVHKEAAGFWVLCGLAYQKQGAHAKATDALRAALALGPSIHWVHHAIAISLLALRDPHKAVSHLQIAVAKKGNSTEYLFLLGTAQKLAGNYAESLESLQRAVILSPADYRIHHELGTIEHNRHRMDEALTHYMTALRCNHNYIPSIVGHGAVLCEFGRFQEGLALFQRAVDLSPNDPELWLRRASALFARGLIPEAIRYAQKALQIKPGLVDAHVLLGKLFASQGKTDLARKCFDNALRMDPGNAYTMVSQAVMLERSGETGAAKDVVDAALRKIPSHPQLLMLLGRIARTNDERNDAIRRIQERLRSNETYTPQEGRSQLHYALGNLYDRLNEPANAFAALNEANQYRKVVRPFSRDKTIKEFQSIKNTFTQDVMERLPRSLVGGDQMVFILGMPRSGTSLAEQILSSHSDVYGAGELTTLDRVARWWPDGDDQRSPLPYPAYFPGIDASGLTELAYRYLNRLPDSSKAYLRITDKMPYNFLHIGMIALLFPKARIIHCVRDPIDTAFSCYMQDFLEGNAFSNDLSNCGWFYNQYLEMMRHWKQISLGVPIMDLRYEELVADPETTVRALLHFCGLQWQGECLDFHNSRRIVNTASYQQVREPLYNRSVGRWKLYESYIQPLIHELSAQTETNVIRLGLSDDRTER